MPAVYGQFALVTLVILFSGSRLSIYGDIIAARTGLGGAWVGLVLVATVTSLPELVTGASAVALYGAPDIAMGDALGSCMFNLLLLFILDAMDRTQPLSARMHQGHVLTAGFCIVLLALVVTGLALGGRLPAVGWVSPISIATAVVYIVAVRMVFRFEQRRLAEFVAEVAEPAARHQDSLRRVVALYTLNAAVVVAAALLLPGLAKEVAILAGLSESIVGILFVAIATSVPELAVGVAALRIGATDLVFGNIFGSNLFNMVVLSIDDAVLFQGSLYAVASPANIIAACAAMTMTTVAIIGLTYRIPHKRLPIAWDSLSIAVVYVTAIVLLRLY